MRAMLQSARRFAQAEHGAVTVDWTVIAAAVVGLGLAGVVAVRTGAVNIGQDVQASLSGASVASLGTLGGTGFVYTLLAVNQATLDGWMQLIDSYNLNNTALTGYYDYFASVAQAYMNAGNYNTAAWYIDASSAVQTALNAQGGTLPGQSVTLESLVNSYNAGRA